jgi:signal transduction histidine kinase
VERRTRSELLVAGALAAAIGVYAISDDAVVDRLTYVGVLLAASALAWAGVLRTPPGRRLVGGLVATGITLTALGDTAWEVLAWQGRDTDVSVADPLWFASYVVLCAALWVVLRRSDAGRDAQSLALDAATISVLSMLLFWNVSIQEIVGDESLSAGVRAVWSAYPVADAVLLALVVRVLMSRGARAHLDVSFAIGVGLWLLADIAFLLSVRGPAEIAMDAAWMVAPVLLARTAWVGAAPFARTGSALPNGTMVQVGIALVPLLVPPVLMLFADARDYAGDLPALVAGATALTLLAMVRTARLMRSEARAHREMQRARDAALEASHAKSMFLAMMSHEIRTPLTMVLGVAELLAETPLDEEQRMLLTRMRRSGDLLAGLVDDVLDFSRIEAGRVDLTPVPVDLSGVVVHLLDAYAPRAARAGIRLEHGVHPDAPATVVADRGRLLQVLGNLLDNATKFTQEGSVRLEVRPAADAPGTVELVVSDTGIGICAADLPTVFESFRQVDGSTTRRYGGTGLGLAICRQLVLAMGGDLAVTSETGVGSTFVVRLPCGPADEEVDEGAARHEASPALTMAAAHDYGRTP